MPFFNREAELDFLEERYRSGRAELLILYGRRRVGKTELLRHFARDKAPVFFVATLGSQAAHMASFSEVLSHRFADVLGAGVRFDSWEAIFRFLGSRAREERLLVILDEFPYLVQADPTLPSVLQKLWDEELRHTQLFLVLCGSSVSFMEGELLAQKSPLYGRRTGQYLLLPFEAREAGLFFPGKSPQERLEIYGILGGVPAYLEQFSPDQALAENVQRRILQKGSYLYDEVRFLLMEELREPKNYFAILRAIAMSKTRLHEIAQSAFGEGEARKAAFYLDTLQELRLVERRVPATETKPHKSRRGIYRLQDNFFRFWFRFVYPYMSALEAGQVELVWEEKIAPFLPEYMGQVFEEVARQYIARAAAQERLPFIPERVGAWWDGREEIDVVAVGEGGRKLLLGECKWSARPVDLPLLDDLRRKGEYLRQSAGLRRAELHYALFSREGFTKRLERRAREDSVLLVTPADIFA